MISTVHYLLLGAALFTIGVIGVLTRRNIMVILMSIELMMIAVNINLIAFSDRLQQVTGQVFAVFVITVAAAEAAVGLGLVIAMFKNKETMNVNEIDLMKWGTWFGLTGGQKSQQDFLLCFLCLFAARFMG